MKISKMLKLLAQIAITGAVISVASILINVLLGDYSVDVVIPITIFFFAAFCIALGISIDLHKKRYAKIIKDNRKRRQQMDQEELDIQNKDLWEDFVSKLKLNQYYKVPGYEGPQLLTGFYWSEYELCCVVCFIGIKELRGNTQQNFYRIKTMKIWGETN